MELRKLGNTDLKIAPLVLGGNVFGWTADKKASFAILDAFLERGFNAIDTADVYNRYAAGLKGGESETVLGEWMKDRGVRNKVIIITKGGLEMGEGLKGLGRDYLPKACEASLKRLQTDYIDVYMTHRADSTVPIEETFEALQKLKSAGKIRATGCSNYTNDELQGAVAAATSGKPGYDIFEPLYNLVDRDAYEGQAEKICTENKLGVVAYYALASGFLTGKYHSAKDIEGRPRAHTLGKYMNPRPLKILAELETVAARHKATPGQVALAWVMARPSVAAPIASATSVEQLQDIVKSVDVKLQPSDIAALDKVAA